jgi:C-terminal processing protease CtpA/Prc
MERLVSGATPQFRRYRAMQELRNGPAGKIVSLELQMPEGRTYTAKLERQAADDSPLRGPSLREGALPRFKELNPDILYIDLDRYGDKEFMRDVLPKLQKAKGVVFDVRGYPTVGPWLLQILTDRAMESDRFADLITRFPDRDQVARNEKPWTMKPSRPRLQAKVAFLTDGRAVSYAETFLSVVANHKLAPIVGGATAGSNGGVNVYVLPGGYRLSYTGQLTIRKDGTRFHGIGVLPTVSVKRTIRAIAQGRDEVLEKALELIQP